MDMIDLNETTILVRNMTFALLTRSYKNEKLRASVVPMLKAAINEAETHYLGKLAKQKRHTVMPAVRKPPLKVEAKAS